MAALYPIYLRLAGKRCLVVGGGSVAERKVLNLLEGEASVCVVSPECAQALETLAAAGAIERISERYRADHLTPDTRLVFAATNSVEVNAQVAADAAQRGVLCNRADSGEEGDFVTPAVVRRGDLCLSVTTDGANPMLTARIRQELESRYGAEYGDFVTLLGQMRHTIKSRYATATERRQALSRLFDAESELLALLRNQRQEEANALAERSLLNQRAENTENLG